MKQRLSICIVVLFFCFSFTVPTLAFAGSTADANAGAIAGAEATSIGGLGIGIGGNASAVTGPSSAEAVTGPSSAEVKDLSSSVKIEDNSVTNVKNINRQFPTTVQPQASQQMQYFGPWKLAEKPWNFVPIEKREYTRCEVKKLKKGSDVDEKKIKIFLSLLPVNKAMVIDTTDKFNPNGPGVFYIGSGVIKMDEDSTSEEALGELMDEAMENGANVFGIIAQGWDPVAETGGWHIGFGGGASAVVGADEKVGVQGVGGTGFGKSWVGPGSKQWLQAKFYRDGNIEQKGEVVAPPTPKTVERDIPIQEKFSPISSPPY